MDNDKIYFKLEYDFPMKGQKLDVDKASSSIRIDFKKDDLPIANDILVANELGEV